VADWKYGDAGDLYPMERGQVWHVNEAYFAVGDLEENDALKFLEFMEKTLEIVPTAFYSDPPWDKGNAKSFRTKAFGKENSRAVDFVGSLLPRIVEACRTSCDMFAIEMGDKHVEDLVTELMKQGANGTSIAPITYYKKHPCRIVCGTFGSTSVQAVEASEFAGMDDEDTPGIFIRPLALNTVVFDCCVGQGLTCMVADGLGHRSMGMELNPRRAACGVKHIVDTTGFQPELVGSFL